MESNEGEVLPYFSITVRSRGLRALLATLHSHRTQKKCEELNDIEISAPLSGYCIVEK